MEGSPLARNAQPLTLLAIVALTAAGLIAGYLVGPAADRPMDWLILAMLAIVSVADIVVVRLVLNGVFTAAPQRIAAGEATLAQTVDGARLLVMAFSTAVAVYGVVAAIMTGAGWVALPFGLVGVVMAGLTFPFVQTRAERLRQEVAVMEPAA